MKYIAMTLGVLAVLLALGMSSLRDAGRHAEIMLQVNEVVLQAFQLGRSCACSTDPAVIARCDETERTLSK